MTFQVTVSGHADSKAKEHQVLKAAKDFVALAAQRGDVHTATASTQHHGSVNLLTELDDEASDVQ